MSVATLNSSGFDFVYKDSWMCNVKVKVRVPSKELRERLGIDDIISILQLSLIHI